MKKILIPIDLSERSKPAIRFAALLADITNAELIFLHVNKLYQQHDSLEPDDEAETLLKTERLKLLDRLTNAVIDEIQKQTKNPVDFQCKIYYHFGLVNSIKTFAAKNDIQLICVPTYETGVLQRLVGSTASDLIYEVNIPIVCVPEVYTAQSLKNMLYFSDMPNEDAELEKLLPIANSLGVQLTVFHFSSKQFDSSAISRTIASKHGNLVKTFVREMEAKSLLQLIEEAIEEQSPSIVAMVTKKDRPFFDTVFNTSNTKAFSFRTQLPLLVLHR